MPSAIRLKPTFSHMAISACAAPNPAVYSAEALDIGGRFVPAVVKADRVILMLLGVACHDPRLSSARTEISLGNFYANTGHGDVSPTVVHRGGSHFSARRIGHFT
jgi:hypothetical protein